MERLRKCLISLLRRIGFSVLAFYFLQQQLLYTFWVGEASTDSGERRRYSVARRAEIAPSTIQIPRASHSEALECPGTNGTTFIRLISHPTNAPTAATRRWRRVGAI